VLGIVFTAAYLLWLYQRTMFGSVTHEINKALPDLSLRDYAILLPLVAMIFWIGMYPKPFFDFINSPADRIIHQVNPAFYQRRAAIPLGAPHCCAPNAQSSSNSFSSSSATAVSR
jgi:NADH:ubiquinone oxidoreductase subunit 4 (subunit M)